MFQVTWKSLCRLKAEFLLALAMTAVLCWCFCIYFGLFIISGWFLCDLQAWASSSFFIKWSLLVFHILCLSCPCSVSLSLCPSSFASIPHCSAGQQCCGWSFVTQSMSSKPHCGWGQTPPSPSPTSSSAGQGREEAACVAKARNSPIIVSTRGKEIWFIVHKNRFE